MIRRDRNENDAEGAQIDMAPMIDCVFLLLIFFIVTSVFVSDPGIEVQKPDVAGANASDHDALLIAISRENRIHFDGREIRLEQVSASIRQAAFGKNPALIIRADGDANHATFAGVYAEAKRAGIARVRFATARADAP